MNEKPEAWAVARSLLRKEEVATGVVNGIKHRVFANVDGHITVEISIPRSNPIYSMPLNLLGITFSRRISEIGTYPGQEYGRLFYGYDKPKDDQLIYYNSDGLPHYGASRKGLFKVSVAELYRDIAYLISELHRHAELYRYIIEKNSKEPCMDYDVNLNPAGGRKLRI